MDNHSNLIQVLAEEIKTFDESLVFEMEKLGIIDLFISTQNLYNAIADHTNDQPFEVDDAKYDIHLLVQCIKNIGQLRFELGQVTEGEYEAYKILVNGFESSEMYGASDILKDINMN